MKAKEQRGAKVLVRFQPRDCVVCGKRHNPITMDAKKYRSWKERKENVEHIFPEMSEGEREILFTGTCPECLNKILKKYGDEEIEFEESRMENDVVTDESIRKSLDGLNAAIEIERLREERVWELRELEQRAKDLDALEQIEERQRNLKKENAIFDNEPPKSIEPEEYCLNPLDNPLECL